jgi:hypothetical protein
MKRAAALSREHASLRAAGRRSIVPSSTAREIGADEEKSAADELIERLAKMPPQPQRVLAEPDG